MPGGCDSRAHAMDDLFVSKTSANSLPPATVSATVHPANVFLPAPKQSHKMNREVLEHPSYYANAEPERPALVMADSGEQLGYGALMQGAARAGRLLERLGCRQGDTICLLSENNISFLEICWAAKDTGLHYACVSTQLNTEDAAYIVQNSGARVFLASHTFAELAQQVAEKLDQKVRLLMFGGATGDFEPYEALRGQQSAIPIPNRIRGASMLYSSGTTGRPKGVRTELLDVPPTTPPLRHRPMVDFFDFDSNMVFINPGPFYHAAPLRMMMAVHRTGGTVIAFNRFEPQTVLAAMEQYRGSHGFFAPTMFVRMLWLHESDPGGWDVSSMRYAIHGGAPCVQTVKEAMLAWWGPVVYELYGGTEGVGQTFIGPEEWVRKKGSVGKAVKGCTIRIVDDGHNILPANEPGLIYLGNGRHFEYHDDRDKTLQAMGRDGLATMGDIGYLDRDGYLFLTDRQSHMIISGGVNIYPQEAENVLIEHPEIEDVAVIGVPNAEFGEEVKAIVVPASADYDTDALAGDIIAFCRARLSAFKCPRSVDFVAELPRSDAGKLLKRLVKAPYWKGHDTTIV